MLQKNHQRASLPSYKGTCKSQTECMNCMGSHNDEMSSFVVTVLINDILPRNWWAVSGDGESFLGQVSSNQQQKMNDSFCCCRVGSSMIGEEDTSGVTLPVFCFTVSLNALTCATVPPQKWTLSSRQVAGCVANCGTLLFPKWVGPFLQSLENG